MCILNRQLLYVLNLYIDVSLYIYTTRRKTWVVIIITWRLSPSHDSVTYKSMWIITYMLKRQLFIHWIYWICIFMYLNINTTWGKNVTLNKDYVTFPSESPHQNLCELSRICSKNSFIFIESTEFVYSCIFIWIRLGKKAWRLIRIVWRFPPNLCSVT